MTSDHTTCEKLIDDLTARCDLALEADRRFFERHPHRSYRFRLASQAEVELNAILTGESPQLLRGTEYYVVIRQVAPKIRVRLFCARMEGCDTDIDENTCRALYERVRERHPSMAQKERVLEQIGRALP